MKDKWVSESGYSLIEMTIAMLLLVIFGLAVFMLAASSTTTYEKLVDDKNTSEELRVASSYLVTKLRQNDQKEAISLESNLLFDSEALTIREVIGDETYITWIYISDGVLREVTVLEGVEPSDDLSFEIAKVDEMAIRVSDQSVYIALEKGNRTIPEFQVTLKSDLR